MFHPTLSSLSTYLKEKQSNFTAARLTQLDKGWSAKRKTSETAAFVRWLDFLVFSDKENPCTIKFFGMFAIMAKSRRRSPRCVLLVSSRMGRENVTAPQ